MFDSGKATRGSVEAPPAWAPKPNVSHSSLRLYNECQRAWLLRYGANLLPDGLRDAGRLEARLSPAATLAGSVVDHAITDALYHWHGGGEPPHNLVPAGRRILRDILTFSREWAAAANSGGPLPHGRYQPVETTYYRDGWTDEGKAEVVRVIETCLRNFVEADICVALDAYPREAWRLPPKDIPPWFYWDSVPVYARYDFAIQTPDEVFIFDWKAGNPVNRPGITQQMHCYAAYAMHVWNARMEDNRLIPAWLQSGEVQVRLVSPTALEAVRTMVIERHRVLVEALATARGPKALEVFPMAANPAPCRRCTFRSCEGYGREPQR